MSASPIPEVTHQFSVGPSNLSATPWCPPGAREAERTPYSHPPSPSSTAMSSPQHFTTPRSPRTMTTDKPSLRSPPAAPPRNPAKKRPNISTSGISTLKIPPRDVRLAASFSETFPVPSSETRTRIFGQQNGSVSRTFIPSLKKTGLSEQENQPPVQHLGIRPSSTHVRRRKFPTVFSYSRKAQRSKVPPSGSLSSISSPASGPKSSPAQSARSNAKGPPPERPSRAAIPPGSIIFSSDIIL